MGKASRRKGQAGEREIVALLKERGLDPDCKRGLQSRNGGAEVPDVITRLPIHFEVKRTEQFPAYACFKQAVDDHQEGTEPVVVNRRSGGEWMCFCRLDWVLGLLQERYSPASGRGRS